VEFRTIAGIDIEVSEICLGTGIIGGAIDRVQSFRLMDRYVELGGNFLDSAKVYSDWLPGEKSVSEKTIGRWMVARKNRANLVLATKGGHPFLETMHISRMSPKEILLDLEQSLINIRAELIDLYWLHRDDIRVPAGVFVELLSDQIKAGKIRSYGLSNWQIERFEEAILYAREHGLHAPVANQMLWSLAVIDTKLVDPTLAWMDERTWKYHHSNQLTAIPYSSQANGLFQKLDKAQGYPIEKSLSPNYPLDINQMRYDRIQQVRQDTGFTITQIVLGYLLSQPFSTIPIIGPKNESQLEDSMSGSGYRLTEDQIQYIIGEDTWMN